MAGAGNPRFGPSAQRALPLFRLGPVALGLATRLARWTLVGQMDWMNPRALPLLAVATLLACGPSSKGADPTLPPGTDSGTPTPEPTPEPTMPEPTPTDATGTYTDGTWTTTVQIADRDTLARTYTLSTDHPQRDGGAQEVTVVELDDQPVLRSGNDVLDALFALAVQEARDASVEHVTDFAFDEGTPVPCPCFETGEEWTWVWTRDTSYAVHLGLAWLDPARSAASMRFKLSAAKPGTSTVGPVVVQDTGSGGSWPVSTDRVVWVFGALELLEWLDGAERDAFRDEAYEALSNTVEQDLIYAVDPADGLLRGETSYLDWREQTYAPWTATDTARIAETKALSTNVAYLVTLRALATWATERGDADAATRWTELADGLEPQLEATFALDEGWASFTGGPFDPGPVPTQDLLGTSLAQLYVDVPSVHGLVDLWPHGPLGPPVIWPQRPESAVYHNRAQWPFVTAYALRAARTSGSSGVITRDVDAMIRGAALNLSNMENFEWAGQEPWFDDGDLSGPVVNSRRQLWSVAGFLSTVVDGLLGLEARDGELTFHPYLPREVRERWMGDTFVLHRLPYRGRSIDVHLGLPSLTRGELGLSEVVWDGDSVTVWLKDIEIGPAPPTEAVVGEDMAPPTPSITSVSDAGVLEFTATDPVEVLRDGVVVASGVGSPWADPRPPDGSVRCYTVQAVGSTGLRSHRALPACAWGDRVQALSTWSLVGDGAWSEAHGRPHVGDWGDPDHALQAWVRPWHTGPHLVQVVYSNGSNGVSTGITSGHKTLRVWAGDTLLAEGSAVMPHSGGWDQWRDSTTVPVDLDAGTTVRLELVDAPNMSELEAHRAYSGGPGGGDGSHNIVNVADVKLLSLAGSGGPPAGDAVDLGSADDLGGYPVDQRQAPGVPLQAWDLVGFEWDADFLYLSIASEAFEDPFAPWMVYLEADPAGAAVAGQGIAYAGLVAELPFTPTHAIAARVQHDAGDGLGPWSGVWVPDGGGSWAQRARLEPGVAVWVAADLHTLSVRVPRFLLDDAQQLRVAAHVVRGLPGNEYKDTWPPGHTPWTAGGDWLEIDLTGPHRASAWVEQGTLD